MNESKNQFANGCALTLRVDRPRIGIVGPTDTQTAEQQNVSLVAGLCAEMSRSVLPTTCTDLPPTKQPASTADSHRRRRRAGRVAPSIG